MGIECLGVSINDARHPVFSFQCDCGVLTELELACDIKELVDLGELAYTCDGCLNSHWMTIKKIG